MMRGKYSLTKRIIAFTLSLVFVFSVLPSMGIHAAAAGTAEGILSALTVADPSTMNAWEKTAFNPTNLSTEHAGGIWTDKSVLTQSSAFAPNSPLKNMGIQMDKDNLLVVLSALAANSIISGSGTTPTDTMFVLDISGSMSATDLRSMVTAANDAIHTLLTTNEQSRVGVVVYSSAARVLLPMDRYTPVIEEGYFNEDVIKYIEYEGGAIRTGRLEHTTGNGSNRPGGNRPGSGSQTTYTYITNSKGNSVTTSVSTGGGTYIQGGLWAAWEEFDRVGAEDGRAPVLVLMSDGAPTFVSNDFNNVPEDYESGDGNSSEEGEGFLTQLTAAYVKAKMAARYSTDTHKANAYVYTVGLGLSSGGNTVSMAEAVLNTARPHAEMVALWNRYETLATGGNKSMSVPVHKSSYFGSSTTNVTVTYDALVSGKEQMVYSDKYFSAEDASQLSATFKEIVNEISLRSSYNVTRVNGTDMNTDGYVTFIDEIGSGMEVKDIEGIVVGEELFTGVKLAQALIEGAFGTAENSTTLGDNMTWSLKQRLGITDTAVVHDLIRKAYNAGQIAYNATTGEFSNYIGWFSDINGDYVGFWDYEDPNAVIPQNAVFANRCYGMLGATTHEQTAHASDMMYVVVQISKPVTNGKVLENSPQTVTFRVPASLLPTVTYQIHVELDGEGEVIADTATIAYNAATPIRLVYEVGVHSSVTPENIANFLRPGYRAKDADGNYYLYTNAWNWTPSSGEADLSNPPSKDNELSYILKDTALNAITYAYFEPSDANEHYYFATDSVVYSDTNGTVYTGAARPNGKYYYKHTVYTAVDTGATGDSVKATVAVRYEELSEYALGVAKRAEDGSWYIPKGTLRRATHSHDLNKTENTTGSFPAVRHQLVDAALNGDTSHAYEFVYMGNNGRITYSPAQGIKLTKKLADGVAATGERFTFTLTVNGDTDGKVKVNGAEATLNGGKLTLKLRADETVTVTGMDVGATYTVTEEALHGYKLGLIAATGAVVDGTAAKGTIGENALHEIVFTNDIQHYGSLLVTKTVAYHKGSKAPANKPSFQVSVTLEGMAGKTVYVGTEQVTVDAQDKLSFTIKDGDTVNITGIPEGTAYVVEELLAAGTTNIPAGFTADSGYTAESYRKEGTIAANETAKADLLNAYTPKDVVLVENGTDITVDVTKNVTVRLGYNGYLMGRKEFSFELLKYNATTNKWAPVSVGGTDLTANVTISNPATEDSPFYGDGNVGEAQLSMAGVTFDSVGSHYFRIAEVIPETIPAGWTYDRTYHDFEVVVADNEAGQLVIREVKSIQHAQIANVGENKWSVSTAFTNSYAVHSTKLTIEAFKTLKNLNTGANMALQDGQFEFALYAADENWNFLETLGIEKNGATGSIVFATMTYDFAANGPTKTYHYVVKETSADGNGITVDTAQYRIAVTVIQTKNAANADILAIEKVTVQKDSGAVQDVTAAVLAAGNVLGGETVKFENTYKATSVSQSITADKTLTDLTAGAAGDQLAVKGDVFSFTLEAVTNGAPMPSKATVFAAPGGSIDFGGITFTRADTYQYKLTENDHTAAGVTKDTAVYLITIVVEDTGAGKLEVTSVTYTRDGVNADKIVFNNTYKAVPPADAQVIIRGNKVLKVDNTKYDRTLKAGEFRFVLKNAAGHALETVANSASGNFTFSALKFDAIGTYTYTVTEVGAGQIKDGIIYSNQTYTVTVTVTDAVKDGIMEIAVAYTTDSGAAETIEFINEYNAQAVPVQLTARKYLSGRELKAGEFSFTLTPISVNAKALSQAESKENDADGLITFSAITYAAAGEYVYTIAENKLDENGAPLTPNADGFVIYKGVTYSLKEYTVTVTVTDNGSGQLTSSVSVVDENGNKLPAQFFNSYKASSVTVNIEGETANTAGKTLEDLSSATDKTLADFEFKFWLHDAEGNLLQTATENDAGFAFDDITFDKAGTYVYFISEVPGGNAAVSYDQSKYRVTVTIEDNGAGQLVVKSHTYEKAESGESDTYETVDAVTFQNTYQAKKTSVSFAGRKTMLGGYKLKGDDFSFILKTAQGVEIETVRNDADGWFAFETIEYTEEGKHYYLLEEVAGDDGRITYDGTKFALTVTVTDVDGQLTRQVEIIKIAGEDLEQVDTYGFTNIYTPEAVETTISVQKVLNNQSSEAMGLNGFTFQLEKDGEKTQLTTDETGKVAFRLTFSAGDVGKTYTYKLTEVAGNVEGMTYSDKVYEITVAVSQKDSGELELTVTREGTGDFAFTNTYDPVEDIPPKTGVDFSVAGWTLMMSVSAICLLAVLVLGKKKLLEA